MGTLLSHRILWRRFAPPALSLRILSQAALHLRRRLTRCLVLIAETLLAVLSFLLAALLFAEHFGLSWVHATLLASLPLLILVRLASFLFCGLWKRSIRAAGIPDLICIVKTVLLGSLGFSILAPIDFLDFPFPKALVFIDGVLLLSLLGVLHFGFRVYNAHLAACRTSGRRFLIVGAGDAASSVVRELATDRDSPGRPVAVVDDDPNKLGSTLGGVSVLGTIDDLPRLVLEFHADEVILCIPSATRSQMRRILASSREAGVPVRTLPTLAELVNASASRRHLREVRIEDLLQRDEIHSDPGLIRSVVGGRTILVTGAGGSIGSELCRQIAAAGVGKLLLVEKSENSLFYIHLELREAFPDVPVEPLLLDVVHRDAVLDLFLQARPDVVFHAAAHKHVHLMELYPHEAICNNVLGTRNVALAAHQFRASQFINISTDKAVNPCSFMGLSKKITELCIQQLARTSTTRFMNVRFGNVAGSTGSVLRLFCDQIQRGGPIVVTDPRATRFFMTLSEAVCLILHAAAQGFGGETFVFDMGEPLNIFQLACTLSLFAGLAPGKDVPIQFVGLRAGEKLAEELWETWEMPRATTHPRIRVISSFDPLSNRILDYIAELEHLLAVKDHGRLLASLRRLFPAFKSRLPAVKSPPQEELQVHLSAARGAHP